MISDTDFPHQSDTLQQSPLIKKNGNHSRKGFYILLIVINLPFVWPIINKLIFHWLWERRLDYMLTGFIQSMITMSPFLLPLAIADFIAVRSYIKKQSPPWKVLFIPLVVVNIIFFTFLGLSGNNLGVAGIAAMSIAYFLLIFDLLIVLLFLILTKPASGHD